MPAEITSFLVKPAPPKLPAAHRQSSKPDSMHSFHRALKREAHQHHQASLKQDEVRASQEEKPDMKPQSREDETELSLTPFGSAQSVSPANHASLDGQPAALQGEEALAGNQPMDLLPASAEPGSMPVTEGAAVRPGTQADPAVLSIAPAKDSGLNPGGTVTEPDFIPVPASEETSSDPSREGKTAQLQAVDKRLVLNREGSPVPAGKDHSPKVSTGAHALVHGQNTASEETEPPLVSRANDPVKELADFENRKWQAQKLTVSSPATSGDSRPTEDSTGEAPGWANRLETASLKGADQTAKTDFKMPVPGDADAQEVLNQVVRKAELMVKANSSQMKIELQPEFLGRLTIKVMVEEGAVTARFITDNLQVKHLLEGNLGMLRQTLEAQGMRVERAEVNVQLNNGGLFDGSEGQRFAMWHRDDQPGHHRPRVLSDSEMEELSLTVALEDRNRADQYGIQSDGSMNLLV